MIEPITTLTVDGIQYPVENLSETSRNLVNLLNKGRADEESIMLDIDEANQHLQLVQHGLLHIQTMLIESVREDLGKLPEDSTGE